MSAALRSFLVILFAACLSTVGCSKTSKDEPSEAPAPTSSSVPQEVKAPEKQAPPSIIFLGDSLTAGLGLPERQAFPALIEKRLKERGAHYAVINAGRSGDTTAGGLARLDWYLKERVNPEILVVFLGSNDAMRGVPTEAMEKNLRAIVKKARAFRPEMKILLAQLVTFPNLGADYGQRFQSLFTRIAEEEELVLVEFPLKEVAGKAQFNQPDGVHPNREGTEKVAEVIWKAVEPQLKK